MVEIFVVFQRMDLDFDTWTPAPANNASFASF